MLHAVRQDSPEASSPDMDVTQTAAELAAQKIPHSTAASRRRLASQKPHVLDAVQAVIRACTDRLENASANVSGSSVDGVLCNGKP